MHTHTHIRHGKGLSVLDRMTAEIIMIRSNDRNNNHD